MEHQQLLHQHVQPVHLVVRDLSYSVKGKLILNNISAHFKPNHLYALMGPSGAGKTTLMNVISGRAGGTVSGQVLVNNQRMRPRRFKMAYKFIPQDDILFSALTPRETLMYAAEFLLSRSLSYEQRKAKVEALIHELHLDVCADTVIGDEGQRGISGGQRKRVSVALELLTNPAVLFVDEPTSGLDSTTAEEILFILRNLAHSGRTIICTIHQPSYDCFKLFDSLMLLCKGEIAYFGPVSKSVDYFAHLGFNCPQFHNPVDYFMDLVQGKFKKYDSDGTPRLTEGLEEKDHREKEHGSSGKGKINFPVDEEAGDPSLDLSTGAKFFTPFEQLWKERGHEWLHQLKGAGDSPAHDNGTTEIYHHQHTRDTEDDDDDLEGIDPLVIKGHGSSLFRQMYTLFRRSCWTTIKDKGQALSRMMGSLVLAVILGLVFLQMNDSQGTISDRQSLLFMNIMFNVMNSLMTNAVFFPLERVMIFREYGNGSYHISAYYIARITVACFFQCIYTIIYGSIIYWMVGFYATFDAYLIFMGATILLACIGVTLGITIGGIVPNIQMAQTFLPLILMPLILFSGFLVRPDNIPIYFKWIYWGSFFQYGYQIIAVNEFKDRTFDVCNPITDICPVGPGVQTGETFLDKFLSYNIDDTPRNVAIIAGWFVFTAIAGLVIIAFQASRKRN